MGVMQDSAFQERILALAIKDRKFLQRTTGVLSRDDFKPEDSAEPDALARFRAAKVILRFYKLYRQPIGGMLRAEVLEYIRINKKQIGERGRQLLLDLTERLNNPDLVVAPEAVESKILDFKRRQRFKQTIEELIDLQTKGELTSDSFSKITRGALQGLDGITEITDYGATIDARIQRRLNEKVIKLPYLQIECFDKVCKVAPRGTIAVALAKYGVGKSNFMVHVARAYAMQGLNVLFFTLEDPTQIVENRLDAAIADLELDKLRDLPKKTKRLFLEEWAKYKANIQIVNATGGGWTVERMTEYWEVLRNRGFIADLVIIDYDKKIEPPRHYQSGNAFTLQSTDVYLELSNWAARDQLYMWIAAQARRPPLNDRTKEKEKMIVAGDDAADDINKLREAALCIGIGVVPTLGANARFLYVAKNRFGVQFVGWPIKGNLANGQFYDLNASREAQAEWAAGNKS